MNKKLIHCMGIFLALASIYWYGHGTMFRAGNESMFFAVLIVSLIFYYYIDLANQGKEIYLRPIAGLKAFEEAVGRATEMGKPVLFIPGISDLDQVETVSGLVVLGHVAGMTAQYEAGLNVPVTSAIVMEAGKDACRESYLKAGRPDLYHDDMVHYLTADQFAYAAGVNGIMLRDRPAAIFYQGKFYAESLILAETGNSINAIQVAGTGSPSQIPFFVTACDYTLIGEEFFAASAYLSKKPTLIGSIKGQDVNKLLMIIAMVVFVFLFGMKLFEYMNTNEWISIRNSLNERVEATQAKWETFSPEKRELILQTNDSSLDWDDLNYADRSRFFNRSYLVNSPFKSEINALDTISTSIVMPLKPWIQYNLSDKMHIVDVLYGKRNITALYRSIGEEKFDSFSDSEKELWKISSSIASDDIQSITFNGNNTISVNKMPPMLYESKRSSEVKVNDLDSLYEKIGEYYFLQLSQSD